MRRYYEKGQLIWVSPGAVVFDIEDVEFLLPWLFEMREGVYPPEPSGGYVESRRPGVGHRAPYETAAQVAAEIDSRLARTGLDLYLVEDSYCHGATDEELARKLQMPPWEIRRRIRSAVSYIASGPCPRWLNCLDCPSYSFCRRKKRVGITYADWKRKRVHQWSERKKQHLPSTLLTNRA